MMALGNLGDVSKAMKDYKSAQGYYEQSLIIAQAINDIEGEALAHQGLGNVFSGVELWEEATNSYSKANELFADIGVDWGIAFSEIGLAKAALSQQDIKEALGYVDPALNYLVSSEGLFGDLRERFLICIEILQSTGDPRASEVLELAYVRLQDIANKINDETMRNSYLENVPWNRELVRLWQEQQAKHG